MENIAYYNGKIASIEEMTIPINDRSSYFGDGVYDATYTRNHIPFALEEHIDRIYRSAAMLKISAPMLKDEMGRLLRELVRRVAVSYTHLRPKLSRSKRSSSCKTVSSGCGFQPPRSGILPSAAVP